MRVYLEEIIQKKKQRLKEMDYQLDELLKKIDKTKKPLSFYNAIKQTGLSIIGEVKKASPSKGLIREDFNPLELAKSYEDVVDAISVLTEEDYFLGKDAYLASIAQNVKLPVLMKDFIIDQLQIYNARALGASCLLLIDAILTDEELNNFIVLARSLYMGVLLEVHTEQEVLRALRTEARIIGINNRNLQTFETDLLTTIKLRPLISKDRLVISESGISSPSDIKRLKPCGIDGVLIGESFMRAASIEAQASALRKAYKTDK